MNSKTVNKISFSNSISLEYVWQPASPLLSKWLGIRSQQWSRQTPQLGFIWRGSDWKVRSLQLSCRPNQRTVRPANWLTVQSLTIMWTSLASVLSANDGLLAGLLNRRFFATPKYSTLIYCWEDVSKTGSPKAQQLRSTFGSLNGYHN